MNRFATGWLPAGILFILMQSSFAAQTFAGYSAANLYNAANTYARSGKPGLAVLNYERARLLDPTDPDIDANLNHVRQTSGLPPLTRSVFARMLNIASPTMLAWSGIVGLLIIGISSFVRLSYRQYHRVMLAAAAAGILLLTTSILGAIGWWPVMHEAVVVTHTASARVSPATVEESLFTLPEATIVKTLEQHDGFILVRTDTGLTGWIESPSLTPIVP